MPSRRRQPARRDAFSGVGAAERAPETIGAPGVTRIGTEGGPAPGKVGFGPPLGNYASPEVDLAALKDVVRRLPDSHPIRQLIEDEPDRLPLSDIAIKADLWVRLLLRGQGRRQEDSYGNTR